jgi:riboflavin kinase / FMN adenylyltransferase
MEVFRLIPPVESRRPCALSIGNFDGVHLGHQAMLGKLKASAQARDLLSSVLTFEPHPREYFAGLRPELEAPARIYGERDKIEAIADAGIDRVCVAHFNESLASLAPERFVEDVLIDGLYTRHLLIGDDFRFGARRAGDFSLLQRYEAQGAFTLERMNTVWFNDLNRETQAHERISSSMVRTALHNGDFSLAHRLLGRAYALSGHVIHGKKLGRTLGFPTLNLKVPSAKPALSGIFVVRVHGLHSVRDGLGLGWLAGVASLGTRPAVENDGKPLLEVHLLKYEGDAYGKLVKVEFLKKLRPEENYPSLDLLKAQIDRDAAAARAFFKERPEALV